MPKAFAPKPQNDADKLRLADHFGTTVSITVQEQMTVETVHGVRRAIKADVTIVDGPFAGKDFGDVLIFDTAIVNELQDDDGEEPIVAQVAMYLARGKECAKLVAPTADAWAAAEKLYAPASTEQPLPF